MLDFNMNGELAKSSEGDGDSLRSCDEERDAEANGTKSVSWTDRNTDHGSTEDTLHMNSIGVGMLPTLGGADDFSNNVEKHKGDGAEMPWSDEKEEGDRKGLLADKRNGEDEATAGEGREGDNDLPFDSFSMLFVAESPLEHCLPLLVFGLQMLILVLIMINLLQTSDRPLVTTMNVPVDVPLTVKISQYIACMVSVFTADDLVSGAVLVGRRAVKKEFMDVERERLLAAGDRRKSEQMRHLMRSISEADRSLKRHWKWELANAMRIIEGATVVIVSFIFIAQSVTAIDLWLNFAAVQFVGMLDDTAYHLARNRFLGTTARHLANRVSGFEVYSEGRRHKKAMRRIRLALFVGIGVAMWAGLSVFVYNQAKLTYACSLITLTVGENRHQYARFYSGHYRIQEEKINGRAVYVQKQGRGAFIAYCAADQINRWTISPLSDDEEPHDPCSNIIMQSQRTKTHDISEIGQDGMQFWTGDNADAYIKCNQCNPSRKGGDCSMRGICDEEVRLCNCDQGFFGDSCQFRGPCTELIMHDEFPGVYTHAYQKSWDLMYLDERPVMVYDRPVYVQNLQKDVFDVMVFDGGRWFVAQSDYFVDWYNSYSGEESAARSLATYLIQSFNARDSEYIASYIAAEPSNFGSPANVPFRAWLTEASRISSHIGRLGDEEYTAYCADCNDGESGISNCVDSWGETDYSLCKSTESDTHGMVQRCECLPGFSGPLCHLRPVEGTVELHLDHSKGMCSSCFVGNPWTVWDLDGLYVPCTSMGKVFFEDGNATFSRELGLHLNSSHFSVFVSSTDDTFDELCQMKEGTEEVYAIRRDGVDERIYVNTAIHLDNRKAFLGEVVRSEEVGCHASTEVDHDVCSTASLAEVYSTPDMKTSLLEHAWLLLDLQVTPSTLDADGMPDRVENNAPPSVLPPPSSNEVPSTENSPAQTENSTILSNNGASNVASGTSESYTFAVIPKAMTNSFYLPVKSGCEERAAALSRQSVRGSVSVECFFVGPTDQNGTEQARIANELIGSVDGIAMAVTDEILAADVARNAFAAGIPFITFDSDAPSTERAAYVGTNNTALGQELGLLLLTRFATSGSYAIVSGNFGPNLVLREEGIRQVLTSHGWNEVSGSPLYVGVGTAVEQMHDLMNTHPDLTAMLFTLGGVMRTAEEEWIVFRQAQPDLVLLAADATPAQLDLLNRGFVDGLVGQQPADMGSKSIDTLLSLSKGHEVEEFVSTSLIVMGRVNEDNPYNQLDLTSAATAMGSAANLLLLLAMLALFAAVIV